MDEHLNGRLPERIDQHSTAGAHPPPWSHWQRTRRLTAWLLALWLATGFGAAFFARELAGLSVFGWPLSFYLAAQGASLVYLAIIALYCWRMRRYDEAARAAPKGQP